MVCADTGLSGFNGFVMNRQTILYPLYPFNPLTILSEKDFSDLI